MQEQEKAAFQAEFDADALRVTIEKLFVELRIYVEDDQINERGFLFESEKKRIQKIIDALKITIENLEKAEGDNRDSISWAKHFLNEAAKAFASYEVKDDAGEHAVDNDIKSNVEDSGPGLIGGEVQVDGPAIDPDPEKGKENMDFAEWKNDFTKKRRILSQRVDNYDGTDDFRDMEAKFNELRGSFETALEDYIDENFNWNAFGLLLDALRKRLDELKNEVNEGRWDKVYDSHPEQFLALHEILETNKALLNAADWDPRDNFGGAYPAGGFLAEFKRILKEAASIREIMEDEIPGRKGLERDQKIGVLYFKPANDFLAGMETRVAELDNQKMDDWKRKLENVAEYPKVVALKLELAKAMPVAPFGVDTPEERTKILKGDRGANKGLILEASEELTSKGYFPDDLGVRQRGYVQAEYFDKATEYLKKLTEIEDSQEISEWEMTIETLSDTIDEILALPPDVDIVAERNNLLNLELRLVVTYESLLSSGSFEESDTNQMLNRKINELVGEDRNSGKYIKAKKKIEKIVEPIHIESNHPSNLSWADLIKLIQENNIDIYDHATMNRSSANREDRQIYLAFHARKGAVDRDEFPDTEAGNEQYLAKEQERIDSVTWIVLSKIESLNQNEGQIPTCTRPDLFPMLIRRQMQRDTILKAITYHPEHGELMRELLDVLILEVANDNSEIAYNTITASGNGRNQINKFMRARFTDRAMNTLYQNLTEEERKIKVEHFFALANVTYNLFDLLTVSFAELQTQTRTEAHQKTKGGSFLEKKNYVQITRPDAALVHNTQRYDSPSHVSALFELYMSRIPADYGRRGQDPTGMSYHEKLVEQRQEIIDFQNCYFDVNKITGENGIEPTSIFDPLYPDTRSFLHLSDKFQKGTEMLQFGDWVWGLNENGDYVKLGQTGDRTTIGSKSVILKSAFAITEWYEDVGMAGWEKIMQLALGDLPDKITEHMILKSSNTGGNDPSLGLIDIMINNGCGMAKMFPGRHMEAVTQLFTHYIMRIFSRYTAGDRYRETTFRSVVAKIQNAAQSKGGLGGYRNVAAQIIRNIAGEKFSSWDDDRILGTASDKYEMSSDLEDGVYLRRAKRIEWILKYYIKEKRIPPYTKIPALGEMLTGIGRFLDKFSNIDQDKFWKMVDGELPLPTHEINTNASLFKSVDENH